MLDKAPEAGHLLAYKGEREREEAQQRKFLVIWLALWRRRSFPGRKKQARTFWAGKSMCRET